MFTVKAVAGTQLYLAESEESWALEETGYRMHPYKLDLALNPDHPEAEVRTTDNCVAHIDELHEAAGRQCYESFGRPNPATDQNSTYLGHIQEVAHHSIFEHGCVTMWCDGWSRNMLLELERHQHHNFLGLSVLSSRYVPVVDKPIVYPPVFAELDEATRKELEQEYDYAHEATRQAYSHAYETLKAREFPKKVAREAAREILPGATATTFYATSNLRGWRDIIGKRDFDGAAKEIQIFAQMVKAELKRVAPNSMKDID